VRTTYRIATTLVALGAVFPFGAIAAHADTAQPAVLQATWYWQENTVAAGPESLNPPTTVSGVPDKDLAVASKGDSGGVPDKETYLAFDVSAIPALSSISRFVVTLAVDDSPQAVQASPPDLKLMACAAVRAWTPGVAGASWTQKPADDCSAKIAGKFDATAKTWTFDITSIAQAWSNGDPALGIGIVGDPTYTTPFQVVFKPATTVKTSVDFTPPAPTSTEPAVAPTPAYTPPVQVDTSGPAPVTSVNVPPVVPQPTPQPPPVALATTPSRRVNTVANVPFTHSTTIPGSFWLAALAGVVLLGVVSLVLGDPEVPTDVASGSVTKSLRQRRAVRGTQAAPRVRTV
jgi:hypothetical protein